MFLFANLLLISYLTSVKINRPKMQSKTLLLMRDLISQIAIAGNYIFKILEL